MRALHICDRDGDVRRVNNDDAFGSAPLYTDVEVSRLGGSKPSSDVEGCPQTGLKSEHE